MEYLRNWRCPKQREGLADDCLDLNLCKSSAMGNFPVVSRGSLVYYTAHYLVVYTRTE